MEKSPSAPPRPNSIQVARRAGVSQSAVSRCFTPGASISAKTREKVLRAAAELGYQPNLAASSLVTKRTNLVAVLLPEVTNRVFPELLLQLSGAIEQRGLRVLLFTLRDGVADSQVFADLLRYQVDGVIMAGRPSAGLLDECRRRAVPIVLFNRRWPDLDIASVGCDHAAAAAELGRRLLASGRRRLALLGGPGGSVSGERERGFGDALAAHGVKPVARACGQFDYALSRAAGVELLAARPDAVFCTNDVMAYALIDALRAAALTPGDDVAVVGFDDLAASCWDGYRLTTVRQPLPAMAGAAVERLAAEIVGDAVAARHQYFPGNIIVRDSARL